MADLKAPERNNIIGRLADILQSGKDTANQYQILPQVPLIGGTGLGDMFMGKAPELVNDISYDGLQAAIRGGNTATGGIGTYGARPAVADAALLGLDVAGIGKGLGGLSRRSAGAIYDKLIEGGTSLSRREAIKKLGALSGGAALTGTGLGVARKFLDNAVTDVAPKVIDNVAMQAPKQFRYNSLSDYMKYMGEWATEQGNMNWLHGESGLSFNDFMEAWYHPDNAHGYGDALKKLLIQDEQAYKNAKDIKSGYLKLDNPDPNALAPLDHFSPQAKQEMKDFKQTTSKLASDFGEANPNESWLHWAVNSPEDDPNYFKSVIESFK